MDTYLVECLRLFLWDIYFTGNAIVLFINIRSVNGNCRCDMVTAAILQLLLYKLLYHGELQIASFKAVV